MRVLGIDPGLTRCGVGVIDVEPNRSAVLVDVQVIRTPPGMPLEERLLAVSDGITSILDERVPSVVAIERVFAQHNLRTVMGTAQVSGVVLLVAAQRGLRVALHTPSEVKAAVTGYGSADKRQVQAMVARILGLAEIPRPADAADALAIAICHAWRGFPQPAAGSGSVLGSGSVSGSTESLTPAQKAWRAAERSAGTPGTARRLAQ